LLQSARTLISNKAPTAWSFMSSGADIRDAGNADIAAMRRELDLDLFVFAWLVMGTQWLSPEYHYPICEFLGQWGKPEWKRIGLCVPRDVGKTTLATRANALWQVCKSPGHLATVVIFNARLENSRKWLRVIKHTVETNPIFRALYSDMLAPGVGAGDTRPRPKSWKWNDEEIEFVRDFPAPPEASITALGIGAASTGGHWTHHIKDDIIGLEESLSEAEMANAVHWVDHARDLESPANDGNELWVYTPWHYADVNRHRDEKWPGEYKIFKRPALEPSGPGGAEQSAYPTKWSTEKLKKMRDTDPYVFSSQYNLEPMAGRAQSFQAEWDRHGTVLSVDTSTGPRLVFQIDPGLGADSRPHYDPRRYRMDMAGDLGDAPQVVPLSSMSKAILWDPAPSEGELTATESTKSHNGLDVVGRDAWWRDYVLQSMGVLLDPLDMVRLLVRLSIAWDTRLVVVEEVNFAKLYKHFVDYVMRAEFPGYQIDWRPVACPRADKDKRVQGLIPDFKLGHLYLNYPLCERIRTEKKEYIPGMKKGIDCLDALAMKDLPGVLPRPRTTLELFKDQLAAERARMGHGQRNQHRRPLDAVNWS
jgi:hypothetical protein